MDKEQVVNIGFEIVAYSGDARTKLLLALKDAKAGKFDEVDALVEEAKGLLNDAHKSQFDLLSREAKGESAELGFMVHAQDHLMTTMLLADIINTLLDIYRTR